MLQRLVAPTYVLADRDIEYGRGKSRKMSLALEDMVDCAHEVIYVSSDRVRTRTFAVRLQKRSLKVKCCGFDVDMLKPSVWVRGIKSDKIQITQKEE